MDTNKFHKPDDKELEENIKSTFHISKLIKELQDIQNIHGDMEVFMANESDAVFDGLGMIGVAVSAQSGEKFLMMVRNKSVISI